MPIAKGKKAGSVPAASRKKAASAAPRRATPRTRPASKPAKAALKPAAKPSKKTTKPIARPKRAVKQAKPLKKASAPAAAKKKIAPPRRAVTKKVAVKAAKPVTRPKLTLAKKPEAAKRPMTVAPAPAKPAKAPIAAKPAKPPVVAKPAKAPAAAKPAATRTRRPRLRISPDTGPVATWLASGERPRPSSFIPAPPRAESPSTVAAPPASSDRLISPAAIEEPLNYRTLPVRVDIEQAAGRTIIVPNPQELTLRSGEGIEWDFRYINGSDVVVQEVTLEFVKPAPFVKTSFRSAKPGSARPHRLVSGQSQPGSAGHRFEYVVRCLNILKNEIAIARLAVSVV